ncbi:PIN domain-containing protein [Mesorhizobium ciceri]|uniref:PIN domain-containing protein n=1 Tax=Mesorhizobium TaxID=68287 RepID=UPI0004796F0A|nr:PIN domain-containing protein [Mesorhizobium ciceri]
MELAFDHTKYSSIVFIDSMVALEGKPLETMPWHEIDPTDSILILVVPQVNSEIDKRKRDGRLGKRARAFNRLIAHAAESGVPHTIAVGSPTVAIAVTRHKRIDWDQYDTLDPGEGDDRVVAQVLYAVDVPDQRKLLLTNDTNPMAIASRHGLKCRRLPDHWLLDPEPSPSEKEVERLKARVRELESAQPKIEISLKYGLAQPQTIFRVHPMPDDAKGVIASHVIRQNPSQQDDSPFNLRRDYSYDERYRDYRTKVVPAYTTSVHRFLEVHYAQVPFAFCVKNIGNLQAESLVLRLAGKGGCLHNRFTCYPIFGPPAPKPRTFLDGIRFDPNSIRPAIVGRHEMQFAVGPDRSPVIEIHCADFRHGRYWEFEGIATLDPHHEGPFVVDVEVTASNMRGIQTKSFDLALTVENAKIGDLVDLLKPGYKIPIPMMERLTAEITAKNWDWIEVVDVDGQEEWPDDGDEDGDDED